MQSLMVGLLLVFSPTPPPYSAVLCMKTQFWMVGLLLLLTKMPPPVPTPPSAALPFSIVNPSKTEFGPFTAVEVNAARQRDVLTVNGHTGRGGVIDW